MRTCYLFTLVILTLLFEVRTSFGQAVLFKANNDAFTGTFVRGPYTLDNLTSNDTTPSGPIFLFAVSKPERGRAEVRPGNVVVYTPSNSFRGEDTFSYAISSAPNGEGTISQASVTIRNPYYLYRGTYSSAVVGTHRIHEESGYLTLSVNQEGRFTAKLLYAGLIYPFKAEFDANGRYTASIQRTPPLSALQLDIQFHIEGPSGIDCRLTNGAEVVEFTAPLNTWSSNNRPPLKGIYTIALPAPDTRRTTPQGSGYTTVSINNTGAVTFRGCTGDNRSFSSSSILRVDDTVPFYAALYKGTGSMFGDIVFTRVDADRVIVQASLHWTKPRIRKDRLYPTGFIRTVTALGSNYTEPKSNTCVLQVGTTENFNSNFTVAAGILPKPRTERALLGNRPDFGVYQVAFDNSKRLRAAFKISPRNGVFTGTFFNALSKKLYRMSGVFVQGENTAYGVWNSPTRTGLVLLRPDSLSNP